MSLDLMHQAGHGLASLPHDALSLSPEMMALAQQGLTDAASWAQSAVAAVSLAGPHVTSLHSLAVLASERLSALQDIDPESYATMKSSMDSVLGASWARGSGPRRAPKPPSFQVLSTTC